MFFFFLTLSLAQNTKLMAVMIEGLLETNLSALAIYTYTCLSQFVFNLEKSNFHPPGVVSR